MQTREYVLFFILGAIWGLSYVFIRVAAPLFGPALLVGLRVAIASGATAGYIVLTGQSTTAWPAFRTRYRQYFVMGLVNAALPFSLISASELVLSASYASILNATTPAFSALATAAWMGRPLTARVSGGIAIGILGVAIAVGEAPFSLSPIVLLAVALSLAGAASYGFGAYYAHQHTTDVAPVTASLGQTLMATVILTPFAIAELPTARWTVPGNISLLGLALLSTFVAYMLYFRVLQVAGPTETVAVTLLIPIFGVIWGHFLLGEAIGIGTVVGLAVVLIGIQLITGYRPQLRAATPPAPSHSGPASGESPGAADRKA